MNLSKVISALKMSLGLYGITLPFKDEITGKPIPAEKVLSDILTNITIPMYSEFVPWVREYDENIKNLQVVDKQKGIYLLPPFLTMTPIKNVLSVTLPSYNNRSSYGGIYPMHGMNRSAQGVINNQAYNLLMGEMRAEPTFEYLGHNKIRLYGFPKTIVTFVVAAEHDENGETIPSTCYDSFMELATLDTKIFLYNNLKLYDGITTAFGTINLKVDDYQSADSERTSLLNEWRDRSHLQDLWQYM